MGLIIHSALFSWLHVLGVAGLFTCVVLELTRVRPGLNARELRTLTIIDAHYGGAALLMLLTGLARVIWFAKGWQFYVNSPLFWVKMALFLAVAIASIKPTMTFARWRKSAQGGTLPAEAAAEVPGIRRLLWWQAGGLVLIPLFAALMARGVGMGR